MGTVSNPPSAVVQLGYTNITAETSVISAAGWTTLEEIEGVEVPASGRLEVSYGATLKHDGFELNEAEDNFGKLALFLDEAPLKVQSEGEEIALVFGGPPEWAVTWTEFAVTGVGPRLKELAATDRYGAFIGPEFLPIAAEPGLHDLSVRVFLPEEGGGSVSIKDRRLVALTGSA